MKGARGLKFAAYMSSSGRSVRIENPKSVQRKKVYLPRKTVFCSISNHFLKISVLYTLSEYILRINLRELHANHSSGK